jgi:hypothetical protein
MSGRRSGSREREYDEDSGRRLVGESEAKIECRPGSESRASPMGFWGKDVENSDPRTGLPTTSVRFRGSYSGPSLGAKFLVQLLAIMFLAMMTTLVRAGVNTFVNTTTTGSGGPVNASTLGRMRAVIEIAFANFFIAAFAHGVSFKICGGHLNSLYTVFVFAFTAPLELCRATFTKGYRLRALMLALYLLAHVGGNAAGAGITYGLLQAEAGESGQVFFENAINDYNNVSTFAWAAVMSDALASMAVGAACAWAAWTAGTPGERMGPAAYSAIVGAAYAAGTLASGLFTRGGCIDFWGTLFVFWYKQTPFTTGGTSAAYLMVGEIGGNLVAVGFFALAGYLANGKRASRS